MLLTLLSTQALSCPKDHYEKCVFGACMCIPNLGAVGDQLGKAVNPLPDMLNIAGAAVQGDVNQLSQSVGGLVIKSSCPSCEIFAQNVMDKKDKVFIEKVVGRGWLLFVSGVDPVIIIADAATSVAQRYAIKKSEIQNPLQPVQIPPQSRNYKIYHTEATCAVISEQEKVVSGWVNPPILTERSTGLTFTFPNLDLMKGDTIIINSANDCPDIPPGQTKIANATPITFEYSDLITGTPTTMKYFIVGALSK